MKVKYFLLVLFFPLLLASCDNDGYSLDEFRVSWARADSLGKNSYAFTLDNGAKLWVAAPAYINYQLADKQRVIIDYTLLSDKIDGYDHYVKLNNYYPILTKNIIALNGINDSIYGNDPVKIYQIFASGGFINVEFGFNYGGQKKHFINLVHNTSAGQSNDGKVYLEFRHNAYDDPSVYGSKGLVAFKPESLNIEEKTILVIKVKEFDKEQVYEIEYDPKITKAEKLSSYKENEYVEEGIE